MDISILNPQASNSQNDTVHLYEYKTEGCKFSRVLIPRELCVFLRKTFTTLFSKSVANKTSDIIIHVSCFKAVSQQKVTKYLVIATAIWWEMCWGQQMQMLCRQWQLL